MMRPPNRCLCLFKNVVSAFSNQHFCFQNSWKWKMMMSLRFTKNKLVAFEHIGQDLQGSNVRGRTPS